VSISFSDDGNDEFLRALLAAASCGETEAVARLYRQFEGLVNFYAALLTTGFDFRTHDVHDLVMDSWVVILRKLPSFVPPEIGVTRSWQTFIQRIVHLTFLMALKNLHKKRDTSESASHYDATPSKIADDAQGIVTQAHQRDLLEKCLAAIAELDPKDRIVLHKHYSEHKDIQRIADETAETKAAVSQRLTRARERLKKFFPKTIDGK
jgi:RNA polymerase sigma factor (sigma-70 family)